MKYLVVSSGALGCLWASILAKNPENKVALIHHRQSFVDALKRQNGILLRVGKSKINELVNLSAFKTLSDGLKYLGNECDCVLLLVKVFTTGQILKDLKKEEIDKLLELKTIFVTFQNSLCNVEKLLNYFPKTQVLFGTTVTHAMVIKDGLIEGTPNRPSTVWSASNAFGNEHKRIVKNLCSSGLPTNPTKDAQLMLWKKLAVNCAINSVTTLVQLKIGPCITECSGVGKELMSEIAAEVARVAQTEGISLSEKEAIDSLLFVVQKATNHVSAMCNDVLNRRQTEIENLNGYVLRIAKKKRVSVPSIKMTHQMIQLIQESYHLLLQPVCSPSLKAKV